MRKNLHFALVIRLIGILQESLVFDGDSITLLRNGSTAGLDKSLGYTHDCGSCREFARELRWFREIAGLSEDCSSSTE